MTAVREAATTVFLKVTTGIQMNHDAYNDDYIRKILNDVKTIAMIGASPQNVRPSYFAFKYLAERGYDMIPVNPGHVGKSLVGKPFVASLADIDRPIDMVDIFRSNDQIMPVSRSGLGFVAPAKSDPGCSSARATTKPLRKAEAAGTSGRDESLPEDRIRPAVG